MKRKIGELTPSKQEYQKMMSENLNGCDLNKARIIHYNANKPPLAPEGYLNNLRVIYSENLNFLDWSVNNHLALSLADTVYLWNSVSGEIEQLMTMDNSTDYISSVSWVREGSRLAIGTSLAEVQYMGCGGAQTNSKRDWSPGPSWFAQLELLHRFEWLTGAIHHHDVRVLQHQIAAKASFPPAEPCCPAVLVELPWTHGRREGLFSSCRTVLSWLNCRGRMDAAKASSPPAGPCCLAVLVELSWTHGRHEGLLSSRRTVLSCCPG
uniref:Anaphase-promoting complex subunit 4 WD40 domain-containing protein n=1 Tax=Strigamia maritima TaxID=126957 RepID=T1J3I0_STRMM